MPHDNVLINPQAHIIYNMTYGIIRVKSRIPADGKGRAKDHIWNPGKNDWDPLDYRIMGRIEKYTWKSGRVVMFKSWFEDGGETYVVDRWMALPMRVIEELGLVNYVLEGVEKKPRWQVILE
jgi:hypothetical protein